jgi:hypothetical protein
VVIFATEFGLQENVFESIYISKIVLVMREYKIKTILKCNKADPDGMSLPTKIELLK